MINIDDKLRNRIEEFLNNDDSAKNMIAHSGAWNKVSFRDWIVTGPFFGAKGIERNVGFVVQVRLGCGAFGSDSVFFRNFIGDLKNHENNAFWKLPKGISDELTKLCECKPAGEPENQEYTIAGSSGKKGFMIPFNGISKPGSMVVLKSENKTIVKI